MELGFILEFSHAFFEVGLPALVLVLLSYQGIFGEFLSGRAVSGGSLVVVAKHETGADEPRKRDRGRPEGPGPPAPWCR